MVPVSFSEFRALARRAWWIVLGSTVCGAIAAYGLTELQTPVYRAEATMAVMRGADVDPLTAQDVQAGQSLTGTYASLAQSRAVLTAALPAIADLGLSTNELVSRVEADPVFGTQLIDIAAEASAPDAAARIANAVAEALPGYVSALLESSGSQGSLVVPIVAVRALPPARPVRPSRQLNTGLGALAGFVVGSFAGFARFWYDDRIRDQRDLARLDVGVLGAVPHIERPRRSREPWWPLVTDNRAHVDLERSLLSIQDSLAYVSAPGGPTVILVSGPDAETGKSTIAVNLSLVLADAGKRVILVDGNLRRPRLHTILGLSNRGGLSAALLGSRPVPVSFPEAPRRLRIVTAGSRLPSPTQAIRSEAMTETIREYRDRADHVILDGPSVLGSRDAVLWLEHADCALLVVRAKRTSLAKLDGAMSAVEAVRRPVAGVILNDAGSGGGVDAIA